MESRKARDGADSRQNFNTLKKISVSDSEYPNVMAEFLAIYVGWSETIKKSGDLPFYIIFKILGDLVT